MPVFEGMQIMLRGRPGRWSIVGAIGLRSVMYNLRPLVLRHGSLATPEGLELDLLTASSTDGGMTECCVRVIS